MKIQILLATILMTSLQAFAIPVVTTNDVEITEPQFVQLLRKAYYDSSEIGSNGDMVFSNVLTCSKKKCTLSAGKWLMHTEPSFLKNVMYTPVEESAVFDLGEYMRVRAEVTYDQGHEARTKTIETESLGKLYSLICYSVVQKSTGTIKMGQCVLYNGLR